MNATEAKSRSERSNLTQNIKKYMLLNHLYKVYNLLHHKRRDKRKLFSVKSTLDADGVQNTIWLKEELDRI